jgi:uncharacterized membrane protein
VRQRLAPLTSERVTGFEGEISSGAVIVLVREVTPDKVLAKISQYGGDELQISPEDESAARLREDLERQQTVAPVA